jgi:UDP-N-acetylglucosamine diphosphorylase/glucosamine-1-phosphate N-acetyltransferase
VNAVILAAGEGSRMRPLTYTRPKVMLPIANKPILEHLLIEVVKAGINDFIFIVGYHDEQVRNYFGSGEKWGIRIEYITQRKRLGTADAIKMVRSLVSGNFLVMNGDVVARKEDIVNLAGNSDNTIAIVIMEDTQDLGVVEVDKKRIVHIYEKVDKPPSNMVNAGLYLFTPEIFNAVAKTQRSLRGEYEITDSLQLLIKWGYNIGYQEIGYWLDLSYPWDLLTANEDLLNGNKAQNLGVVEDNVVIKGAVHIGENSVIRSGCYIVGPVMIGQNCDIGPNCYIRPFTSIGNGCRIGAAVEVKSSIIMKGTKIPHHSYLGDSVVGEGCNFGSGTKIANLRLDKRNILVSGIDTKRRKLGAIIGDGVETGINASINVGSMIGNNAIIGPGAVASGIIAPGARVF